jgi:hypothetical protein
MFRRNKKGEDPVKTGPYLVESAIGNRHLQNVLNRRDVEGYDMVSILQGTVGGANAGRNVVFKNRPGEGFG